MSSGASMIEAVRSTDRFVGDPDAPRQVVEVDLVSAPDRAAGDATVVLSGPGLHTSATTVRLGGWGSRTVAEVAFRTDRPAGTVLAVEVTVVSDVEAASGAPAGAGDGGRTHRRAGEVVVAQPGWTIHLVSHFHFDPVWWNTQSASVSELDRSDWSASPRMRFQRSAFDTLDAHLALAVADADYRFCVAEVDYLAPYLDAVPAARPVLRRLIAEGRVEVVGGTHNEPNTNLTGLELTRRNLIAGLGFQRGVLGAEVATAWQLDVFGHDPAFPSVLADAGVGASCWARGPYRQWGPMLADGFARPAPPEGMQLDTVFDWLGPDGRGVLTAYLANHYSSAFVLDECASWWDAAALVLRWAAMLRPVTSSPEVLLTVGTDLSPPARWITELPRRFAQHHCWPRIVCSTPSRYLAAVRAHHATTGRPPLAQSRDMNPLYTGKDVSYIDTKQAQRAGEELLGEAETWATLASVLDGAPYPEPEIDEAWRLLIYGAHHDAITGTESDQVYLDLLAGWRRAHDLAGVVQEAATGRLAAAIDTTGAGAAVVVFNPVARTRTDVVRLTLDRDRLAAGAHGLRVVDHRGDPVPTVVEDVSRSGDGGVAAATLAFVAPEVPGIGYRSFRLVADARPGASGGGWVVADHQGAWEIANEHHRLRLDPERGGCVTSWTRTATGEELLAEGGLGNELLLYPEYPTHPVHGEGPWHLSPAGSPRRSGDAPASVRVLTSDAGCRAVIEGPLGDGGRHVTTITLWSGVDRVDVSVDVHGLGGADHLLRLRWPCPVPGSLPVAEVGEAAVGRGFAMIDVDAAEHPWTLDSPAHRWCASSHTARVLVGERGTADRGIGPRRVEPPTPRAIGCAEVIVAGPETEAPARALVAALARSGVTATTTRHDGPRYGALDVDSNLPDVRIALGVGRSNLVAEDRLDGAPDHRALVDAELGRRGAARVWLGASRPLRDVWVPGADLRAPGALPILAVIGADPAALAEEVVALGGELDRAHAIDACHPGPVPGGADPAVAERTVGIINRGTPGFAIDVDGAIAVSLLRASTGWPSGQWIDPPRRTVPDGSGFGLQHWSHHFELALVARNGDWRRADLAGEALAVGRPLSARVEPAHPGRLPSSGRLVGVDAASDTPARVEIVALKPTGNPLASGWTAARSAIEEVTIRCSEVHGARAEVDLVVPFDVAGAATIALTEEGGRAATAVGHRSTRVGLDGFGHASVVVRVDRRAVLDAAPARPAVTAPASPRPPTFSRYWVQNRGPAPHGGPGIAVHLHAPGDRRNPTPGEWCATVASNAVTDPLTARLGLTTPPGWRARLAADEVVVHPGEHAVVAVDLAPPTTGRRGPCRLIDVVRVVARVDGVPRLDCYDERHVRRDATVDRPVAFEVMPATVEVVAGGRSRIGASLRNDTGIERWAEVEVLSPWGTWHLVGGRTPVVLPPDAVATISLPVAAPPGAAPGVWWYLLRAVVGPDVVYSASAPLVVGGRGRA